MKKSKLLILTPTVAMATIMPICSCGNQGWTAEKVIDAIFGPVNLDPVKVDGTIMNQLKNLSPEQMQAELIYDLYGKANEPLSDGLTLKDLYENGTISFTVNISKCSLEFKDDKLIANFIGYIQMTFLKDFSERAKKGDYEIDTYKLSNLEVVVREENKFSLYYNDELDSRGIIGFKELKMKGGTEEHIIPIEEVNTYDFVNYAPTNSHNWIKK